MVRPIIPFLSWTTAAMKDGPSIYFTLNVLYYISCCCWFHAHTYLVFVLKKMQPAPKKIILGNGSNKFNLVYPTNRKLKLYIFSCTTWATTICGFTMLDVSPSFTRHRIFSVKQLKRIGGAKFPILETDIMERNGENGSLGICFCARVEYEEEWNLIVVALSRHRTVKSMLFNWLVCVYMQVCKCNPRKLHGNVFYM